MQPSTAPRGRRFGASPKVGVHVRDAAALGAWGGADAGRRPGLSTDRAQRLKELERENRELKRANEILRKASAFSQAELDRRAK